MSPAGKWTFVALLLAVPALAQQSKLAALGPDGRLHYAAYTEQGDRLPDFSHCGYGGGGVPLPNAAVKVALEPQSGGTDDAPRIQAALDRVAALPLGADGLRGVVLLRRGTYRCGATLRITASGVVLRGEGKDEGGTLLLATFRTAKPLVQIGGKEGPKAHGPAAEVADDYVPVGAVSLTVDNAGDFVVGQKVFVIRRGNAAWISAIGMDRITPRAADPGSTRQWQPFELKFDRVITAIDGRRLTFDAPIGCALDRRWGGGAVQRYDDPERIAHCGVEFFRALSAYDPSKRESQGGVMTEVDEEHATWLMDFGAVKNAWARHLVTEKFQHGPAVLRAAAKWVTVEDCSGVAPVSLITGGRRYTYNIQGAQLVLVQRCYADEARHAFVFGARVPGPNVFLDCKSERNHARSEPHERWSVAGLFDNVDSDIALQDRQSMGTGHGWSGANYVAWNCRGMLICQQPPTAQNFAIGFTGQRGKEAFAPRPAGWWESEGTPVTPRSLYQQQLLDRLSASR
ncbi:MAG: hypothetical protein JNG82_01455 [Opitutaceae bacterium]|nr:hypothetical protein [Opitutaceae bacterium]